MENAPSILAVYHPHERPLPNERVLLEKGIRRITEIFNHAASTGKKRNLFIEMDSNDVEMAKTSTNLDPFEHAVREAWKNGWNVIPLDRKAFSSVLSRILTRRWFEPAPQEIYYANRELRENYWKQVILRNATKDDFIVMHPAHVEGFLHKSGIIKENVTWIHEPHPSQYVYLDEKTVKDFKLKRKAACTARRARSGKK